MQTWNIRIVDANANPTRCASCGGQCCANMPGSVLPSDLSATLDPVEIRTNATALLKSGRYAIDWWEGSPLGDNVLGEMGYYLRPAVKGSEGRLTDPSWGGACTFHTAAGCALSEAQRPGECKMLVPVSPGLCYFPEGFEGKRTIAQLWWPYRGILNMLRRQLGDH